MGWNAILYELDARLLAKALPRLQDAAALSNERLRALFDDLGQSFNEELDEQDGDYPMATRFECVLTSLAGRRFWLFEGGEILGIASDAVARLAPEFAPVSMFSAASGSGDDGWDIPLPELSWEIGENGMYGIWSAEALRACLPAVDRLDEPEALEEFGEAAAAVRMLDEDDVWQAWCRIREAVSRTIAAGNALAYVTS